MAPGRPEKQPGSSKRHGRSHSFNGTASDQATGLTGLLKPEKRRSRKHDREGNDSPAEPPNKRLKLRRGSEPPMCKDTSMIPKAKPEHRSKDINHRKASRTSNYHELKEQVRTLEQDLVHAEKKHNEKEQKHIEKEQKLKKKVGHLESRAVESERAHQSTNRELEDLKQAHQSVQQELVDLKQAQQAPEQGLEDSKQALEDSVDHHKLELASSSQTHADMTQNVEGAKTELECTREGFAPNTAELDPVRKVCDEKAEEIMCLKESCQSKNEELAAKDAEVVAMQRALDEAKKDLTNVQHKLEAALIIIDDNGSRNVRLKEAENRAKNTLHKIRQELRKKISDLETDIQDLQRECTDCQESLESQEDKSNETIARLQKELQDSLPQSQRFNFKVPDAKVMQDFNKLQFKIRQFVDAYTRPVIDAKEQDLQIMWPGWSPKLHKFLSCSLTCSLAFEGYMWERLLARIFAPWSRVWDGHLGRSLEKILSMTGEKVEILGHGSESYVDHQHWRSNSSSFIGRLGVEDFPSRDFDPDIETMVAGLAKLCGYEANDTMKADAMEIFTVAREFEIQLRKLKAVYTISMCEPVPNGKGRKYGFCLDDNEMTSRLPSPAAEIAGKVPKVDFIMSPGLHKRGSNDGDGYEGSVWLIPMGVVCNAAEFISKQRSSTSARPLSVQPQEILPSIEVKQEIGSAETVSQKSIEFKQEIDSHESGIKTETPDSGATHIKNSEIIDSFHKHKAMSAPKLTSGPPIPMLHDEIPVQPSTGTKVMTRSQASPKVDGKRHDRKGSTKSDIKHLHPMKLREQHVKSSENESKPVKGAGTGVGISSDTITIDE